MKKDLDEILKYALTPNEEPDFWLNQKIRNRINEKERTASDMKRPNQSISRLPFCPSLQDSRRTPNSIMATLPGAFCL